MASYKAASTFGWLDFDATASERTATLLKAFEEPGTLDPLGLGSIRDCFSELLAPGTSTIQTRLRYFLFVPWICQGIERDRVAPAEFASRLRDDEAKLIECLRHLGPDQGVLGYVAGRELKRMPSVVYWGGLGSWGLRRLDLSITEYGRRIGQLSRRRIEVDDDRNPVTRPPALWAALPGPPRSLLHTDVDFDLTVEEATLLIDHIRRHHPRSLLAETCRFPAEAASIELPWDLPAERLRPELQGALHHARCVSELTLGPQHVYNLLVARRAGTELQWDVGDITDAIERDLADWVNLMTVRGNELNRWVDNLDEFWHFVARLDTIPVPTRRFITDVVARAAKEPEQFIDDPQVHQVIRDREILLKSNRAKLGPLSAMEGWNRAPVGGQLVYRWPIARGYLDELGAALAEHA
jgi:hypothetical protein